MVLVHRYTLTPREEVCPSINKELNKSFLGTKAEFFFHGFSLTGVRDNEWKKVKQKVMNVCQREYRLDEICLFQFCFYCLACLGLVFVLLFFIITVYMIFVRC